ncbi:uncharacterized protein LOC134723643 [Mytilus trossulus]|uniref:uncharacterized protein LOC134723643 n=1 Tax=Mytilus trossulus TaxID=6551 RepID=UPI003003F6F5
MKLVCTCILFVFLQINLNQIYVSAQGVDECPICDPVSHLQEDFCKETIVVEVDVVGIRSETADYDIFTATVVKIYRGNEADIPIGSNITFTARVSECIRNQFKGAYIFSGVLGTVLAGHYDITFCQSIRIRKAITPATKLQWIEHLLKKLKSIGCEGKHHCLALPDIPKNKDVKNACLFPVTPANTTNCYLDWGACLRTNCNVPCTWFYAEGSNCAEGDSNPDVVPANEG